MNPRKAEIEKAREEYKKTGGVPFEPTHTLHNCKACNEDVCMKLDPPTPAPDHTEELELRHDLNVAGYPKDKIGSIIRAVNSHAELVEALKNMTEDYAARVFNTDSEACEILDKANEALTRATLRKEAAK